MKPCSLSIDLARRPSFTLRSVLWTQHNAATAAHWDLVTTPKRRHCGSPLVINYQYLACHCQGCHQCCPSWNWSWSLKGWWKLPWPWMAVPIHTTTWCTPSLCQWEHQGFVVTFPKLNVSSEETSRTCHLGTMSNGTMPSVDPRVHWGAIRTSARGVSIASCLHVLN